MFWEFDALLSGDREVLEHVVVFLEADPWFFRSGSCQTAFECGLRLSCLRSFMLEAAESFARIASWPESSTHPGSEPRSMR